MGAARRRRPSRMTATPGTRIGKLVGPRTKKSGAARTSRWDALRLHLSLTTVTQVIPIGKLGGAMTKKSGAAPTSRRAARSELAEAAGSLHSAVLGPCASQVHDRGIPSALERGQVSRRPVPAVTLFLPRP